MANLREVKILGVGMTPFGKHLYTPFDDLGARAVLDALDDARVPTNDIEAAWCGHVFGGPVAGQRVMSKVGLSGIPVANVENYCSSGSTALRDAWIAVGAGVCDIALVVGIEKLYGRVSDGILPDEGDLEGALGLVMASQYAMRFKVHSERFGTTREQLALISVKNHRHSVHNPNSQYRKEFTVNDVLASRPIVDSLNLLDCCPIGDGAAAIVIGSAERARQYGTRPVSLKTVALNSGRYQTEPTDLTFETITAEAAKLGYEDAGIGPEDVNVAEVHDCFTMAEILRVEAIGFCEPGEYGPLLESGHWDIGGKLPINPSGGLLSKGHPLGATGVAQVCELTWQLRGQAGARQIEGARTGLAHCRGGTVYGTDGGSCTVAIVAA